MSEFLSLLRDQQGLTNLSKQEVEGAWVGWCLAKGLGSDWSYDLDAIWPAYQGQ